MAYYLKRIDVFTFFPPFFLLDAIEHLKVIDLALLGFRVITPLFGCMDGLIDGWMVGFDHHIKPKVTG